MRWKILQSLTLVVSDKSIPSFVNLKGLVMLHSSCYKEVEAGLSSLRAFAALLRPLLRSARRWGLLVAPAAEWQQTGTCCGGQMTGLQHRSRAVECRFLAVYWKS